MAGSNVLGEVEFLVLLAVLRLEDDAYAVTIRELLAREAGMSVSRGTVYVTLERLERKGLVASRFSEPVAVRGGKSRRYFRIRPQGTTALKHAQRVVDRLVKGTILAREEI